MLQFFSNISKVFSLFENENVDKEAETQPSETSIDGKLGLECEKTESVDLITISNTENVEDEIKIILSDDFERKNFIVTSALNLYKVICENLEKRKIYDVNQANTAEILALLQEIQAQLDLIRSNSNFISYEKQYYEILFSNLTSEIIQKTLDNEKAEKTLLHCQIKVEDRNILSLENQEKTSWQAERHFEDEANFEEFLKEIQEGLNRGFYRKRRRCWNRFSFAPTYSASDQTDFKDSVDNQVSNFTKNETPLSLNSQNKKHDHVKSEFSFPVEKDLRSQDENNPFQKSLTSLTPTLSVDQKLSIELGQISKISDESSRSVESASNASSLSLSAYQLEENKQNDLENEMRKKNSQLDVEQTKKMKDQQNENATDKSEDVESGSGPNLIIADESVSKLARALNIAKRFQNENKVLWQQITKLKGLINEKDLEIKRIKLHSKKDATQEEIKILKDKLTFLEQEQITMGQNLRKSEKLCREYERDLDSLEKNLQYAERRGRRAFKIDGSCRKESPRQCVDFGATPEKEKDDQESENECFEEGGAFGVQEKTANSCNDCNEKPDNTFMKRHMSNEKSRLGQTLRSSRLKKEAKKTP